MKIERFESILLAFLAVILVLYIYGYPDFREYPSPTDKRRLETFTNSKYTISVFDASGGATTGFSIYLKYINNETREERKFLYAYQCEEAEVTFLTTDSILVKLNPDGRRYRKDIIIDLAKDTTFYNIYLEPQGN